MAQTSAEEGETLTDLSDDRIALIRLAGDLIRGDWSGYSFDGRDVKRWLETALSGTEKEVAETLKNLRSRN